MPGLASILQRLAMTDPLSVRTPPFMPSRVPIGLGGSVAAEDLGGIGVDSAEMPPDVPMELPPQQGPGVRQRLLGAVPGILRGAAIGLSMPSTGSGAMDAARAFVASGDDRDAQTMRQVQLQQQRERDARQSILDSMRMEEHRADMDMLPIRQDLMRTQAEENRAQAARNAAMDRQRSMTPEERNLAEIRGAEAAIGRPLTDREKGSKLGLYQPIYDQRPPSPPTNAEAYWARQAADPNKTPEERNFAIQKMNEAVSARRSGSDKPIINTGTGQQYVRDPQTGMLRAVDIQGAKVRPVGRPGGGRQMTPGQTRKAEVEDAANQAVKEADAWIKQSKRTDLNVFDLAISNLDKFFAKDPRVIRAKPEIVAEIRKLQALITNTGPQRRRTDEDDANLNSTYGNTQNAQPSTRPASSAPAKQNPFPR